MVRSKRSRKKARHFPVSNSQPELLLAKNLRKSYGDRVALRALSFSLKAGRILGFLGPNGAGKTTAIRILTTMIEPDSGHFVVAGISSKYPERIRHAIGVLPEGLGFPKHITAIEYLTFFGQLYGAASTEAKKRGLALLGEVGLAERAQSLIGSYSHGMRQRLGIARALVNDPVVIFLDEPTLGLDPRGQQDLLMLVRRIAQDRNAGIIVCSHALSEIEAVCDDVVILSSGQVVASGSVADVTGRARQNPTGKNVVRIQVPRPSVAQARQAIDVLDSVMKVTSIGEKPGLLRVELGETADRNKILGALIRAKIPIVSFEVEGGRLQDVFLDVTQEAIT